VRSPEDVSALKPFDGPSQLPAALNALRLTDAAAGVPILGFAGAPFTLACYLIEGSGSRHWEHVKTMMFPHPTAFGQLLDFLAEVIGDYLQAQIESGAAAVQLFDTWAGALSAEDFRRWALPAARKTLSKVDGLTVYFTRDAGPFLNWLPEVGSEVISLDWRVDIGEARDRFGRQRPVQGNLDPLALHAPAEEITRRAHRLIQTAGSNG